MFYFLQNSSLIYQIWKLLLSNNKIYVLFGFRNCKTLGTQAWVILSIIITELLITLKFDWETITTPLPRHIQFVWILLTVCIIIWTTWHFYLQRLLRHTEKKIENGESPRDIQGEQHRIQNGNYLKSVRPRKTLKNH